MENTKIIKCLINGENVGIEVKQTAPYLKRAGAAKAIAEAVISNEGEYRPWLFNVHYAIFVLTVYTNFVFPENWGDNEVVAFMATKEYNSITSYINSEELCEMLAWVDSLVEYRKKCYEDNAFARLISVGKELLLMLQDELAKNPEFLASLGLLPNANKLQ